MIHIGYVPANGMARIPFSTNAADGSAITFTGTVANVKVYKDGSTTERASSAGITLTKDFDGVTGSHLLSIDLADNTAAGFWVEGSDYALVLAGITVDSKTVSGWVGAFKIGAPVAASVTGVVGAVKKNAALANFAFPMFDATGLLKTGLTVTVSLRLDGGAFANTAGSATEIGASGWYTVNLAQAETNGAVIAFSATASGAVPTCNTIITQA